jgi:hypothetical protein
LPAAAAQVYTRLAMPRSLTLLFADNLERFLAGRPLREAVDRARGY